MRACCASRRGVSEVRRRCRTVRRANCTKPSTLGLQAPGWYSLQCATNSFSTRACFHVGTACCSLQSLLSTYSCTDHSVKVGQFLSVPSTPSLYLVYITLRNEPLTDFAVFGFCIVAAVVLLPLLARSQCPKGLRLLSTKQLVPCCVRIGTASSGKRFSFCCP